MFLGKKWQTEEAHYPDANEYSSKTSNKVIFFGVILFLVLIVAAIVFWFFFRAKEITPPPRGNVSTATSTETSGNISRLPVDLGGANGDEYAVSSSTENIRIEDLTFGHFYEPPEDDFQVDLATYELPLNIKVDASNYYDLSRKINIDAHIDQVNQQGFAIFDNKFNPDNSNFFNTYRSILEKDLPVVVTSDFIYYYYQNELKLVFKEIEKNTFFENIWGLNKELYDIALTRYKKKLAETGLVNDPVLEGERLELVYFAVALKLLMPTGGQINKNANFIDEKKFSIQEADVYNIMIPNYISSDVEKEVALIREAKSTTKSPSFLYVQNYNHYKVPAQYNDNAKLNNFYLTLKWLNSVFPLYYRDENCPKCLLDYDDWVVNFAAASFIAKDIYENQEIKNQWAIIYKFISFFSGLRADLNYLHYNAALTDLFGPEYAVEDIFSNGNVNRDKNLQELRSKILDNNFLPMEGAMRGYYTEPELVLGLRVLQEPYWPNDYLFRELSGPDLVLQLNEETKPNRDRMITLCKQNKTSLYYRCTGHGLDLVDLLYPVVPASDKFRWNKMYDNFEERLASISGSFNKFDVFTWNSNVYWLTLDVSRSLFDYGGQARPTYAQSLEWQADKDVNTALGAWVNLHLPEDRLVNYNEKNSTRTLGSIRSCNQYNYIEPNLDLINELMARNTMLIKMLSVLKVAGNTNTAAIQLKELNNKLSQILKITKKQIKDEAISDDECRFITELVSKYALAGKSQDYFSIKVDGKRIEEKIDGVKLLLIYYQSQDKNILGIGPLFNYKERVMSID